MEDFIILLAFRIFKEDINIGDNLKNPNILKILLTGLVANLIITAVAIFLSWTIIWIITLVVTITISIALYLANPSRSCLIYVIFGIFGASFLSAVIGIGVQTLGGFNLSEAFWNGFFG